MRLSIDINKQKIVDSYFQAVRNKLGSSKRDARQNLLCCFMVVANFQHL